ncbi:unnamed protein product [Owenia fusiformis]|uniref:Peptidase A1 domain-containing protein n=1 Tax=Owenia fusiformis TaxID=6347 RepID=A0A8S4PV45_OWEFU|nr:unnamed protein product [Owenia fusiformis]
MQVGTPPQKMNVLVDTGSSNFAIACSPDPSIKTFFHTDDSSSYTSDGRTVKVPYTQGKWEGPVGQDMVRMSSLKNVSAVESYIACITTSDQFFINGSHWEGILGLAYSEIARPDNSVEPFFDTLVRERDVPNLFSMQLCGTLDKNKQTDVSMGGSMVIGAIDPDLYKGEIFYTPLRKEWYYEVVVTDIQVEGHSLAMDCKEYNFDKTIVDSGTTNLRLPTKVFTQLVESIKMKTLLADKDPPPDEFWSGSSVLCWSTGVTPWDEFPSISIHLAKTNNSTFSLVLSPQQYLRAVGEEYDPSAQEDCFKFAVAPSITGMVLGAVLMEGFYVIFDRENQQIGFAQSSCNVRNPKGVISRVEGPFTTHSNVQDCAYIKPENNQSTMITVAYCKSVTLSVPRWFYSVYFSDTQCMWCYSV